jgi:hypothetical protein
LRPRVGAGVSGAGEFGGGRSLWSSKGLLGQARPGGGGAGGAVGKWGRWEGEVAGLVGPGGGGAGVAGGWQLIDARKPPPTAQVVGYKRKPLEDAVEKLSRA